MTNTKMSSEDCNTLRLDSAKNMTVCGQICLRDFEPFEIYGAECVGLPSGVSFEYRYAECITFHDGIPYPDILSNGKTVSVKSHCTQVIWVSFAVSEAANRGDYEISVAVKTSGGEFRATVNLTVYSVTLPEPKNGAFSHEYFFSATEYFSYKNESTDIAERLDGFYRYERYSDQWWSLMETIAKTMKDLRANVFWLPSLELLCDAGSRRVGAKEWQLNFELIDRMVEIFLKNGSFYRIVIKDHIDPADGTEIKAIDENGKLCRFKVFDEDSEAWASAFYGGLYRHFSEKGWLHLLFMHLQDEPHHTQYWKWAREKCRVYLPGISCGEPLDTHEVATQMDGFFDLYIPRIDIYAKDPDFYRQRQKEGKALWCYTCCYPEEHHWLNRFIDQPHVYCRLIPWACFSQGITGYLHWGFNYWDSEILSGVQPGARFKGDGFIVYPDAENNSLALSARAVATRDGIQEYELLVMLAEKAPKKAKEISESVAKDFTDFSHDVDTVNEARRAVLTTLESVES